MTDRLTIWFRERSLREQRMLLVMVALLAVTVLWLGIVRPIADARAAAYARHVEAVSALGRARADAAALRTLDRRGPVALDGPLATVVSDAFAGAGFDNAGVTPQGDARVVVAVGSARPSALFALVADLEARGILVERLAARANDDQTVGVDVTLIGRGR